MSQAYTIQSNARRAARKAGVDPNSVYCVPEGWKFPDPPTVGEVFAAAIEAAAAEPGPVGPLNVTLEQIAAKITPVVAKDIGAATELADYLDAKAADRNLVRKPKVAKATEPEPIRPALGGTAVANAALSARVAARKPKPAKPTKAKPAAKPRGKRDGVCDRVIAAIRARWTSVDELMKLSGWQRHTLRGYISTRAGKDGFTVERRKVDGVSQYRVA